MNSARSGGEWGSLQRRLVRFVQRRGRSELA